MKHWGARLIGALIGMTIEVSVASQVVQLPAESDVIAVPAGCEASLESCAVRVRAERRWSALDQGERRFVLGPSANVLFQSPRRVRLFSGGLWVLPTEQPVHVETTMGEIAIRGEAFISGQIDGATVINLGGQVTLEALAAPERIRVPPGMRNQLSGVSGGYARVGIPQMATPTEILMALGPIFWGTRGQFREWIQEHKEVWSGLEDVVADLHFQLAQREIASQNAAIEKERALARARAEERRQLRRMFFQKTFGVE